MTDFAKCLIYLICIGAAGFLIGRVVPKKWFRADRFPFRPFRWEKQGAVYNALGVRRWKELVPDMSRIFPSLMPPKKLPRAADAVQVERMLQETCVAEWVHALLGLLGFGCVLIWKGAWGWIVSVLYCCLGNLPYIVIQRHNRPKLARILQRMQAREREP